MRRSRLFTCVLILLLTPILVVGQVPTQEDIQTSIDKGINFLVNDVGQNEDGSWGGDVYNYVAYTGFVLTKLCDVAYELGYESPYDPDYLYSDNVIKGFNYLFSQARDEYIYDYGVGGFLDMSGIYIGDGPVGFQPEMYNATLATMALGACRTPLNIIDCAGSVVNGLTHLELMQGMVDFYRWAQNDSETTNFGGWGNRPWLAPFYCEPFDSNNPDAGCREWGNTYSDNSSSGYVVFALEYAEAMGCEIPLDLKENLSIWIDFIQIEEPVDGAGGSGYFMDDYPELWHNLLRTGNLLAEMAFVDYDINSERVQSALDYIETNWDDPGLTMDAPGWRNFPMAMYSLMKGFNSYDIETIFVGGNKRNWYEEFATYLLGNNEYGWPRQAPEGAWYDGYWGDGITNTCWALLILEGGSLPSPFVLVNLDIHPTSWPNPLNVDLKGVTPIAILGTEDFDVSAIDPTTLLLEGVAPLRWAYEDVTTPVYFEEPCNATEDGSDGFVDLSLKFDTPDLVAVLGDVNDGDELVFTIVGQTFDGQNISGDDCVLILKKTKDKLKGGLKNNTPEGFEITNYPNPFSSKTSIQYQLPNSTNVLVKVFNAQGKEIALLVDQYQSSGYHSIEFDSRDMESGIYFYKLITDTYSATKKMVLKK